MSRFTNPVPQFWLDNGTVAASGLIEFYENGNFSAKKDTFADSGLTIKNTNPVNLDGQGRMPSCFGQGLYSVKLYAYDNSAIDKKGALQWSRNDVDMTNGGAGAFDDWSAVVTYALGDAAKDNGKYYSLYGGATSKGERPSTTPAKWEEIAFLTVFNTDKTYSEDEIVIDGGFIYRSLEDNNNDSPPSAKWGNLTFNDSVVGDFTVGGNLDSSTVSVGNLDSGDANKLDWYLETSSFVPVVRGSSTPGAGTYSSQAGKATRVGNVVFFSIGVGWSAHTGTGDIIITGLPYNSAISGPIDSLCVNYSSLSIGGSSYQLGARIFNGVSQLSITRSLNDGSGAAAGVPLDTSAGINISGFYFTN